MQYITQATLNFGYTIEPRNHMNNSALRYHLELYHTGTCEKTMFSNPVVTPAVAPTTENPVGVPGLAVFSNVAFPHDGIYVASVCYANNDDLNAVNVVVVRQGGATIMKVAPVTEVVA